MAYCVLPFKIYAFQIKVQITQRTTCLHLQRTLLSKPKRPRPGVAKSKLQNYDIYLLYPYLIPFTFADHRTLTYMKPGEFYKNKLISLQIELDQLLRKRKGLGILRLGSIIVLIAALWFLWSLGWEYILAATLVLITIFVKLVKDDVANKDKITLTKNLIAIQQAELNALDGKYFEFDGGEKHMPKDHQYAHDMDIFGHASLFQFLNRTTSEQGSRALAESLLHTASLPEILERQESIKELCKLTDFRHLLQAYGLQDPITHNTESKLLTWIQEPTEFIQFKHWQWIKYLLPVIACGITLAVIFEKLDINVLYITYFLMAVVAFQINKVVGPLHNKVSQVTAEADTMMKSLLLIEKQNFESLLLKRIQEQYLQESKASEKIAQLKTILERLDIRYNVFLSFFLNILLQWNLQQVLALEAWKKSEKNKLSGWFYAIGETDALSSLANLNFNEPDWVFPKFKTEYFSLQATGLGHPLIAEKQRINNQVTIQSRDQIMLVTGSNMAGKSTYLRSIGTNIVLAMAGAPVCASIFELSPVQLMSSMRITDNLEENTSTFYAELKKLKTIIEKVNTGDPVFILLDEILRGTNSLDRHTGSIALIKQLLQKQSPAIIATHDVALAALENEFPSRILNYHFDVQVKGEELYFDYTLKAGICTSMNASILMKKIGIEL